jgi:hypothetical protein
VPIVIPCAIDGGLSEMILFLVSEHNSVGILTKKNQDGGDIRVGRKFKKINHKNSKIHIFQKSLPRFVVLSSTNIL